MSEIKSNDTVDQLYREKYAETQSPEEIKRRQAEENESVNSLVSEAMKAVGGVLDTSIEPVKVHNSDNLNKCVYEVCEAVDHKGQAVLVAAGKHTQKLVSVVEIVKQKFESGDTVVLLDKSDKSGAKNVSEFKLAPQRLVQYNRLGSVKVTAPMVDPNSKYLKHKDKVLEVVGDVASKKTASLAVLLVLLSKAPVPGTSQGGWVENA